MWAKGELTEGNSSILSPLPRPLHQTSALHTPKPRFPSSPSLYTREPLNPSYLTSFTSSVPAVVIPLPPKAQTLGQETDLELPDTQDRT